MSTDQLTRQIDAIEQRLREDDPWLVKRFVALERRQRLNEVAVFALLTISAVLLAITLMTRSAVAGGGGVAAYLASFLVDGLHQRKLHRPPRDESAARWR